MNLPLVLPLLCLGSDWTMQLLELCLCISSAPVLFLLPLRSEEASKDHILRCQSETGSKVRNHKGVVS